MTFPRILLNVVTGSQTYRLRYYMPLHFPIPPTRKLPSSKDTLHHVTVLSIAHSKAEISHKSQTKIELKL